MRRFAKENGLALSFLTLFLGTLVGQSFAGQQNHNATQAEHGEQTVSWWRYVVSPDFGGAVMENWQSEFLQFSLFIAATIWLVQKGSNESKSLEAVGREGDEQQMVGRHTPAGGPSWARANDWRTRIYENSLLLVMTFIFLATWGAQSLNNWRVFNDEQEAHDGPRVSWARYLLDPDFWEKTLQNWQSEFLAIGTIVVFTIYLRQRGSPESKPSGRRTTRPPHPGSRERPDRAACRTGCLVTTLRRRVPLSGSRRFRRLSLSGVFSSVPCLTGSGSHENTQRS